MRLPYIPQWQRNLYLISLGVFVASIAFSIITPFLPIFLMQLGLKSNTSLWSGLVFSINSLAFGIMAPIWGSISDRYGKKPMMARAGLGMGLTYFLMAMVHNHIQLFVLRGINGLLSGYIPAAITLVAASSRPENLNYSLGIVQAASAIGNITGPLVGGITAKLLGIRGSMVFTGILLCIAAILPFAAKVKEEFVPKPKTSILKDIAATFQNRQLVILYTVWLLIQAALMAIFPTLPLLIGSISKQNAELYTGIIFSIVGVSTALGAPLVGRIRNYSTVNIFRWSLLACGALTALQGLATSIFALGALRFLFGFFNSAVTVAGNVLIAKSSDQNNQGSSFGMLNSIMSIGLVSGPIIGGYLGDHLGLSYSFFGGAVLLLAAYILSIFVSEPGAGKNYA
ncbi:MAG: transporter, family, multidrug resistance protein [Thermoanaerobacteraceae bacterium]|nr:transporter, family, multidrug resistance protein [Thermoanaerobacteraceae bacterium]